MAIEVTLGISSLSIIVVVMLLSIVSLVMTVLDYNQRQVTNEQILQEISNSSKIHSATKELFSNPYTFMKLGKKSELELDQLKRSYLDFISERSNGSNRITYNYDTIPREGQLPGLFENFRHKTCSIGEQFEKATQTEMDECLKIIESIINTDTDIEKIDWDLLEKIDRLGNPDHKQTFYWNSSKVTLTPDIVRYVCIALIITTQENPIHIIEIEGKSGLLGLLVALFNKKLQSYTFFSRDSRLFQLQEYYVNRQQCLIGNTHTTFHFLAWDDAVGQQHLHQNSFLVDEGQLSTGDLTSYARVLYGRISHGLVFWNAGLPDSTFFKMIEKPKALVSAINYPSYAEQFECVYIF